MIRNVKTKNPVEVLVEFSGELKKADGDNILVAELVDIFNSYFRINAAEEEVVKHIENAEYFIHKRFVIGLKRTSASYEKSNFTFRFTGLWGKHLEVGDDKKITIERLTEIVNNILGTSYSKKKIRQLLETSEFIQIRMGTKRGVRGIGEKQKPDQ